MIPLGFVCHSGFNPRLQSILLQPPLFNEFFQEEPRAGAPFLLEGARYYREWKWRGCSDLIQNVAITVPNQANSTQ